MSRRPLPAFAGVGIELEYMIVDRTSLSVLPIADRVLRGTGERWRNDVVRGEMGWSNELALHLLEVKNIRPQPDLVALAAAFQEEVRELDARLDAEGARLMPGGMHPWMDPHHEAKLWPHRHSGLYRRYDRIFGCRRHGWANLQSMHVNLPFADDAEFERLHAAVRLVLPILPALAASSPFAEGRFSGFLDNRLEAYRTHQARLPASIGEVIPDTVSGHADYEGRILEPMYREAAALDPEGLLHHEWLNARGAIARFDRNALEIRVIDVQECPRADLAVAAATIHLVRKLYDGELAPLAQQQRADTAALARILRRCIVDADEALIDDPAYLSLLGCEGDTYEAGALWRRLLDGGEVPALAPWSEPLAVLLDEGPLARRILHAAGNDADHERLGWVYRELCEALHQGRMFHGVPHREVHRPMTESVWRPAL